jgi:hypothetical protein
MESECPGAGSELGLGSPLVEYQWTTGGCFDGESWIGQVSALEADWTSEITRSATASVAVGASEEGAIVIANGDLVSFDAEGRRVAERVAVGSSFQSSFVVTASGQTIAAAQTGGIPQYRVFDQAGKQVWLRLLASSSGVASGFPGLTLDAEGKLWVALRVFGDDGFSVELQRWEIAGERLTTLVLPERSSTWLAVDDAGHFALVDDRLMLFDAQGVELGAAAIDDKLAVYSLAAADEGFWVGGSRNDRVMVSRIDGEGSELWSTTLDGNYIEYGGSYVFALAGLPDGGVVAVGQEDRISVTWDDSPLIYYTQPFVVGLDAEGRVSFGERIAASGSASGVAVSPAGDIYVSGYAQGGPPSEYGYSDAVLWLRRYVR